MNVENEYYLSASKYNTLEEIGLDFETTKDSNDTEWVSHITAEQLYKYLPPIATIDGDECKCVITSDWVDDEEVFILSYERIDDQWVCKSFYGDKMTDVIYDAILYFDGEDELPMSCYKQDVAYKRLTAIN